MKPANLGNLIERYLSGEPLNKIANESGFTAWILKRIFKEAGVKIRSRTEAKSKHIANIEGLIEKYLAGKSLKDIAIEMGVSAGMIRDRFVKLGVPLRSFAEAIRMSNARNLSPEIEADIIKRYQSGETVESLATAFDYASGKIMSQRHPRGCGIRGVLSRAGISIRGSDQSQKARWARSTPEQRLAQVASAQRAGAKMRESTLNVKMSPYEWQLFGAFVAMGVPCSQQRAVGTYNLDIAMNEFPVAVEIEIGSAFSVSRRFRVEQRTKYLTNLGWAVIYVIIGRRRLAIAPVANKVLSLLDRVRADKSILGQYGVVDCQGQSLAGSRYDFNAITRIPGF